MGKVNIASGDDQVPVQAGEITGRADKAKPAKEAKSSTTTNVCTGNARVGLQADTVVLDGVTIRMH